MKDKWKWLALPLIAATGFLAYTVWPKTVDSYSSTEMEPYFTQHLDDLQMRIELGEYTSEDVDIAREKLYEIVKDVGTLEIPSDMDRRMEYRFGDVYIFSNTYAHRLLFIDRNADGMIFGSLDYIQVSMPSGWDDWQKRSFTLTSPPYPDSEQWSEDVYALAGDYEQTLVLNYMKLLQHSDNGVVKIGNKKFDLLE